MRYDVQIKEQAAEDLKHLLRNEPKAYKKALQLIAELYEHPTSGTGCIAPLSLFQIAFSYYILFDKCPL